MSRLCPEMSIKEDIIKLLFKKRIYTLTDLIQEETEKLSVICNISFKDVLELKQNLVSKYSATPQNGLDAYYDVESNSAMLPTGIERLLDGGLATGNIFELCGLSGDGKTQTCLSIALNVAHNLKQRVHYVDTKSDFVAHRIHSIHIARGGTAEEISEVLKRINVTRVKDMNEMLAFVYHLGASFQNGQENVCRLIIVDSLPPLYAQFIGEDNKEGLGHLNHLASQLKMLSCEFHVVVLVVNIASAYIVDSGGGGDVCSEAEWESHREGSGNVDPKPGLGKYWLHVPSTRLLIQKPHGVTAHAMRTVKVLKSTHMPAGASCNVSVTERGVVS